MSGLDIDKISEEAERTRNVAGIASVLEKRSGGAVGAELDRELAPFRLPSSDLRARVLGSVAAACIGDVLGANVEFHSMSEIAKKVRLLFAVGVLRC